MKKPIIAVGLLFLCGVNAYAVSGTVSSYFSDKRYDLSYTCEEIKKTPSWPEAEGNPPFPARKAREIAENQLAGLFRNAREWRLDEITIQPACEKGWWIYIVSFSPPPPRPDGGIVSPFRLLVLMNGKTVKPKISPWPAPTK